MKKKNTFSIKKFLQKKENKKFFLIFPALLALVIAGILIFRTPSDTSERPWKFTEEKTPEPEKPCQFVSHLNGECLATSDEARVIAVMIENHSEARPQAGLSQAKVVYEAPVEGSITRFLALYTSDQEIAKVGPVRSARPYFLDWTSEYGNAMYMHVGGSPEALEKIKQYKMFDLNEFYFGKHYWRSANRSAPHNTYSSSERWNAALAENGSDFATTTYLGLVFDEKQTNCTENCVQKITVNYAPPVYQAVWKYSSSTQQYERFQMNKPHVDEDGKHIFADSVVVVYMNTRVLDDVGRLSVATVGEGKAVVFSAGGKIEGKWKKENRTARMRFVDSLGSEIALKAGKLWIQVVPTGEERVVLE